MAAVLRNNPFVKIQKNWKAAAPRRCRVIPRNLPLRDLLQRLRDAGLNSEFRFENRSTYKYYDTQDGRLFKSGMRLVRDMTIGAWILTGNSDAPMVQAWAEEGVPDEGEFAARVKKLVKNSRLIPLIIIQRDEKKFELQSGDGTSFEGITEEYFFADHDGKRGRGGPALLCLPDAPPGIEELCAGLIGITQLRPFEEDILAAGLSSLGLPLPGAPIFAEYTIGKEDTVRSGLEKIVMLQGYRIWANTHGTLLGLDPEFLHDMRVATRRLRSALRFIPGHFDEYFCLQVKNELAWMGDLLGRVRDMDVFIEKLEERIRRAGIPAAGSLMKKLEAVHAGDRRALNRAIKSNRFTELMDRLVNFKKYAFYKDTARDTTLRDIAADLIRRGLKRTSAGIRETGTDFSNEKLHRLRILFKRLRYTCEYFTPLFDERIKAVIRSIVKFQDCLGEHQDAIVAITRLESLYFDLPRSAREQGVAGAIHRLIQDFREESARKKEEFLVIKPEYELISGELSRIMAMNSMTTTG